MSLSEIYGPGRFGLSFELFPPKTPRGETALLGHVRQLMEFHPSYITCTYGAGGSTRDKTLDIVRKVKEQFQSPVASHLTCVGSTVDQLRSYLAAAERLGIDSIVALRGDPPEGQTVFTPAEGGLRYANELVALIRREHPRFGVAVGGYPETHREAPSPQTDLENLKRKVDAGADVVITQLFYHNDDFFRFRERCKRIGLRVPLVPGILPVTSLAQIHKITSLCNAKLNDQFVSRLARRDDDQWQFQVGVQYAIDQVQQLVDQGAPGVHFYVLNKSQAATAVLRAVRRPPSEGSS